MNKLAVTVTHHPAEGHGLTFAYAPRMVQAIKTRVPSSERRYDAKTKTWWVRRRSDLEALTYATNGWAEFTREVIPTPAPTPHRKSTLGDFRQAQATVQARNAESRKHAVICRHCEQPITVQGTKWVHVATKDHWCGIDTYATPEVAP